MKQSSSVSNLKTAVLRGEAADRDALVEACITESANGRTLDPEKIILPSLGGYVLLKRVQ